MAEEYLKDGSIKDACPPLKAILTIMATGTFEGKDASHPDIRAMFTLDYLLGSEWYRDRLRAKQRKDIALWKRHVAYLESHARNTGNADDGRRWNCRAGWPWPRRSLSGSVPGVSGIAGRDTGG